MYNVADLDEVIHVLFHDLDHNGQMQIYRWLVSPAGDSNEISGTAGHNVNYFLIAKSTAGIIHSIRGVMRLI